MFRFNGYEGWKPVGMEGVGYDRRWRHERVVGMEGVKDGHARMGLHVRGKIGKKRLGNAWNGWWKVVRGMGLMGIGKWV